MRSGLLLGSLFAASGEKPVTKVITLLKEIEGELKAEIERDQGSFDKMQCWCKKTKETTEVGIDEAQTCIAEETASIESNTGKSANNAQQAKGLEEDIADDQATLKAATEAREKALESFTATELELVKAVSSLKGAVAVLKKHQSSFLQNADAPVFNDREVLGVERSTRLFASRHSNRITPAEQMSMQQFLQQPSYGAYSSQSGNIFGILQNMLDQFTEDLTEARGEEAAAVTGFAEQKKLLTEKIAGQSEQLAAKNAAKAEADTAKAASEEKLRQCQAAEEQLTKTLRESQTFCADNKAEFAVRSAARASELEAVGKAIGYLDSPEAFAKFDKAFGFTQVNQSAIRARAFTKRAMSALKRAQHKSKAPGLVQPLIQLVQAEVEAKTGAKVDFSKVIVKIDDLVASLKEEIAKNTADKDACVKAVNTKTQDLQATKNEVDKLKAKVAHLEENIANLVIELEDNVKEKEGIDAAVKTAGENRAVENGNFQQTMKENKEALIVLKKAKEVLAPIFGAFLQMHQDPVKPKPEGFGKYEKNAGGNKVIGLLDEIIGDTEKTIAVATSEEQAAQTEYEKFQKNSNDSLDALASETATLTKQKGETEADLAQTNENLNNEVKSAADQETSLNAKKEGCSFLLDNFTIMQDAKKTEIEALNEAKAFLKGMQ